MDESKFQIQLCSLEDILGHWSKHRLDLWKIRILDHVQTYEKESLEFETQIKIIQNHPKFIKALGLETIELVKSELSKFISPKMIDYALGLKISQILKLNEKTLSEKLGVAQSHLQYWSTTTPMVELRKQLVEQVNFYRLANLPRSTTYLKYEDLPTFKKVNAKSYWVVVSDKGWELSMDTPIRGRGFTGSLVSECTEFCTFVDSKGSMEGVSVFSQAKKLGYEKDLGEALLVAPDREGILIGLGVDNTLICRVNETSPQPKKAFSRVGLKKAIFAAKSDQLVVVFENGMYHVFEYEDLEKKATVRVATGWKDRLLGHKVGIKTIIKAHDRRIYYKGKIVELRSLGRIEGDAFSLGEKNFCVNPSGQRSIMKFEQVPEGLEFIYPL